MPTLPLRTASAAALDRAALRLRRTTRRLWAGAQVRLKLAAAAPRSSLVGASVIPTVRYRDVPKAVDWLTRAFGMRVHRIVADAEGAPRYAELTVGAGMLMVAPIEDTAFGRMMVQPDEIGGVETQVCYLCVTDARAHSARARAAGAVIVIDPDDEANKGRGYSCRDPEGHVWNFGVYDPWSKLVPPAPSPGWGLGRVQRALVALVLLAAAGTLVSELWPRPSASAGTPVKAANALAPAADAEKEIAKADAAPVVAPPTLAPVAVKADTAALDDGKISSGKTGDKIDETAPIGEADDTAPGPPADRAALETAEKAATEARSLLATTRSALAKAEHDASSARAQMEELQRAKLEAERAAIEARAKLASLQKTADRARAEAALERARRRASLKARKSVQTVRPRGGTWCYSLTEPSRTGGRLYGFCKG